MDNQVPMSRGLGSSATAIVAGIKAANVFLGNPFSRRQLLQIATDIEGHPDNVAPAIFGNLCCSAAEGEKVYSSVITVPEDLHFAVVVPEILVSTEYARSVLPQHVPYKEAVRNVAHASLFVSSMITNQLDNLRIALQDYLHVPYRKTLIPHCDQVFTAAKEEGAYGATISGSGSTLIAYCPAPKVEAVAQAMGQVYADAGIAHRTYTLKADSQGARQL